MDKTDKTTRRRGVRGLPDGFRACSCGYATRDATCRCGRVLVPASEPTAVVSESPRGRQPTKTEDDYAREHLAGLGAIYEGLTFRMANGHRYTPDWVYWQDGRLHAVEVKGGYRLGSYQRARLAFDQAAVEFPLVVWRWAERSREGWSIAEGGRRHV